MSNFEFLTLLSNIDRNDDDMFDNESTSVTADSNEHTSLPLIFSFGDDDVKIVISFPPFFLVDDALSKAEKNAQVSKILMEKKLWENDSFKQKVQIENEMYLASAKSQTDASFYRVMKEAKANRLKLTSDFLHLKFI